MYPYQAQESMNISHAMVTYPMTSAAMEVNSPLHLEYWKTSLTDHPDLEFVSGRQKYIVEGLQIGYKGIDLLYVSHNWPLIDMYHDKVRETILANAAKGWVDELYYTPPHRFFRVSLLSTFPKKHTPKLRVVNGLSWPPHSVINESINKHDYTFNYTIINDMQ